MNPKVFISYSRRDFPFVRDLVRSLRGAGIDLWLDVTSIRGSDQWNSKIEDALQECTQYLIVVSPYSLKSPHVQRELRGAMERHKVIVPVLLQTAELGEFLANIEYIDFRVNYDQAVTNLVSLLRGEEQKPPDWLDIPPKPTSYFGNFVGLLAIPSPRPVKVLSGLIVIGAGLKLMVGLGSIMYQGFDGAFFGGLIMFYSIVAAAEMYRAANRRVTFAEMALVQSLGFILPFFPLLADTPIWQFLITTPLDCAAVLIIFRSKSFRRWMIAYPYGLGAKN